MRRIQPVRTLYLGLLSMAVLFAALPAAADDWPGWRGPNRDGVSQEIGLRKQWPEGGPKLLWKAEQPVGEGFSGPAVVGKVLYTMGDINNQEGVLALDLAKQGRMLWATPIGPVRHKGNGYPGPRATPTIDGERLYTLGINGDLVCMSTKNGKILWRHDLVREFGGAIPQWGYSESPLVDGPLVLCTPGGPRATIVALQKTTGKPVWASAIGDPAGYSSIIKTAPAKTPQYVTLTGKGIVGVDAKDGHFLWRYNRPANGTANIPTCVALGQTVFGASGYGTGGGMIVVRKEANAFKVQEMYFTREMRNHHGGFVLVDMHLYGCDEGTLTCIDYRTGKTKWRDNSCGKASVVYADGMLFCRSERGPISLVEATPEGFKLKGRFNQPDRSGREAWPHLVIANGQMFVRDQEVLLCYDVKE